MSSGPTSRVYFSQRLRLHYVDWGNPAAPPLLLVHGGRDHCRNWDWVAEALRDEYHIIAPDLRGHGDSAWSASGHYTMASYIHDLAQLIHQQELAPVSIVAHSLGGNIASRYAGIYPDAVRRLVVIEGIGPPPRPPGAKPRRNDRSAHARLDRREPLAVGAAAAALRLDRGRAAADAGGEPAPLGRAGAAPDAARREPERGRHL